ncbi:MAG: C39 family peptidase [Spirochaetales bacterium]|nr:C39 family peptidase [Spirochaetales bacterium]
MRKCLLLSMSALLLILIGCAQPYLNEFEINNDSENGREIAGQWVAVPGNNLKQISVGNAYHVWGVNDSNYIYYWDGSSWINVPGRLKHVSVGNDGTVWGINPNNAIYRRDGSNWLQIPGSFVQVAVGNANYVWSIDSGNAIYRWTGSSWEQVPGALKCVAIGNDGKVWGVNPDNVIYRRDGANWIEIPGRLKQISVGNANYVWGVNPGNAVYKWTGTSWEEVGGSFKCVAIGNDGTAWGVNPDGDISRWDSITITPTPTSTPTPTTTPITFEKLDVPFISQLEPNPTNGGYDGRANCGPASLAMCIDAYGKRPSGYENDHDFVHRVRYQMTGVADNPANNPYTTIPQMQDALSGYYQELLPSTFHTSLSEVKNKVMVEGKPVIAFVYAPGLLPRQYPVDWATNHFIVVTGYSSDGQWVYVNDPLDYYDGQQPDNGAPNKYTYDSFSASFLYEALAVGPGLLTGPLPTTPPSGEIIVDDGDPGFSLEGTMAYWYYATNPTYYYNHDMYWTYVNGGSVSNWIIWRPNLPEAGNYKVEAWITWDNATTGHAPYTVYYSGGSITYYINQLNFSEEWVSLGTHYFNNGTDGYVKLTDATGEDPNSLLKIGVDALRWTRQ